MKKILNRLQNLIHADEYHDVIECAQMLVSEILAEEVKRTLKRNDNVRLSYSHHYASMILLIELLPL